MRLAVEADEAWLENGAIGCSGRDCGIGAGFAIFRSVAGPIVRLAFAAILRAEPYGEG